MEIQPLNLNFGDVFAILSWLLVSGGGGVIFIPPGLRLGGWIIQYLMETVRSLEIWG